MKKNGSLILSLENFGLLLYSYCVSLWTSVPTELTDSMVIQGYLIYIQTTRCQTNFHDQWSIGFIMKSFYQILLTWLEIYLRVSFQYDAFCTIKLGQIYFACFTCIKILAYPGSPKQKDHWIR